MFALKQKKFFQWETKNDKKKFDFEKLKISQDGQISGFGSFNFSN